MPKAERRRHVRHNTSNPVKVRCMMTGKYMGGRLSNASASGALLEISQSSLLVGGQRLQIGIAWNPKQAVLGSDQFMDATVVRSLGLGGVQHVAIKFDKPVELAIPA